MIYNDIHSLLGPKSHLLRKFSRSLNYLKQPLVFLGTKSSTVTLEDQTVILCNEGWSKYTINNFQIQL